MFDIRYTRVYHAVYTAVASFMNEAVERYFNVKFMLKLCFIAATNHHLTFSYSVMLAFHERYIATYGKHGELDPYKDKTHD